MSLLHLANADKTDENPSAQCSVVASAPIIGYKASRKQQERANPDQNG